MTRPRYIVVAGCSAGGQKALTSFVAGLTLDDNVTYFLLQHSSREGLEKLFLERIQGETTIPCFLPTNNMPIEGGCIYIARAGFHNIITKDHTVKLTKGAFENRWRPSIDVLFRSAAVAYQQNAIGIILSGLLDDGTSGMIAIQKCGGATIVQNPLEASFPDMPNAVLGSIKPDHCVSATDMAAIIKRISKTRREKVDIPPEVLAEANLSEKAAGGIEKVESLPVSPTPFTCPDCGGALWEIEEKNHHRFRCHTGHSYSESDYEVRQSEELDTALWVAYRMMQERLALLEKMQADQDGKGMKTIAEMHAQRIADLKEHISKIRQILLD